MEWAAVSEPAEPGAAEQDEASGDGLPFLQRFTAAVPAHGKSGPAQYGEDGDQAPVPLAVEVWRDPHRPSTVPLDADLGGPPGRQASDPASLLPNRSDQRPPELREQRIPAEPSSDLEGLRLLTDRPDLLGQGAERTAPDLFLEPLPETSGQGVGHEGRTAPRGPSQRFPQVEGGNEGSLVHPGQPYAGHSRPGGLGWASPAVPGDALSSGRPGVG